MGKLYFSRREFLNKEGFHNMANIVTSIQHDDYQSRGDVEAIENRFVEAYLSIADCDRKISLDIDLNTSETRENAIYKVTTLIDVLTDFKNALVDECKLQELREQKINENEASSHDENNT